MSIEKNIRLQVNNPMDHKQQEIDTASPTEDCNINIRVTTGWEITGHYRNQTLQTITLQKFTAPEEK